MTYYDDYDDDYDDDDYEWRAWTDDEYDPDEPLFTRWERLKIWFNSLLWRITSKFRRGHFDDIPF